MLVIGVSKEPCLQKKGKKRKEMLELIASRFDIDLGGIQRATK